ncbi:DUF5683 domain-containing protein [Mongoliitalea daihaiensis]|uniref:DUF5683 domain-containing protein n=1 Tax=Mongoliitalea daihaiensis TaxID=2782006 RepID=UPI001F232944|nr:DUF5683 domain-containing protein [Mongoliitalea daihaiensis]UJP63675.1 hypothetical protein IPZ59_12615 [Mongoliitalea daihaiensis]
MFFLFFFFSFVYGFTQQLTINDTLSISLTNREFKDPKVATILSAVLPGAGQVYNNKAWKVPIIYGGFATNIFFIDFNNRRYQLFLNNLRRLDRQEPTDFPNLNRDGLVRNTNFWRRNRDLNYFLFIGIYALNILDANIDAHLSSFDVSEDLSFRFEPSFETLTAGGNILGLSLKINF